MPAHWGHRLPLYMTAPLTKSQLTAAQSLRKDVLESKIKSALDDIRGRFIEIGRALTEIRDDGLYGAEFDTFDDYCKARWKFSSARAYQLIAGVDVVERISTIVDLPNEASARPLVRLEPAAQIRVAKRVAKIVKGTGVRVTAKIIEAEVVKDGPCGGLAASLAEAKAAGIIKNRHQVTCPQCQGKGLVWEDVE